MIPFNPPFYLSGVAGSTLGATRKTLEELRAGQGRLTLTSLDVDIFSFVMDARLAPIIPDDEQELALWDDKGNCLHRGYVTRSFDLASMSYSFEVSSVWKRLSNAPMKADGTGRPYRVYEAQDLAITLRDLLLLAKADGLAIQPPAAAEMPKIYTVPKMALKSKSYVEAIITVLKYAPDVGARMDYNTSPPTLRFIRRGGPILRVDYDVDGCGLSPTGTRLTPKAWLRARGVSIHYAQRLTQATYSLGIQTGGDVTAEADRQISLMLSGYERTDSLTAETLATSIAALADAQTALTAVGAAATSAASTAALPINYATFQAKDSRLAAYTMEVCNGEVDKLYNTSASSAPGGSGYQTHATAQMTVGGVTGTWYLIKDTAFTDEQLTLAGAVRVTGTLTAELRFRGLGAGSIPAGMYDIDSYSFSGWAVQDVGQTISYYVYVTSTISVTLVNMSPTAIAAAVVSAIEGQKSALGDRANFVQPPAGLAANYFAAQNWTPLDGSLRFTPDSPYKPQPADRVQIHGTHVDPNWKVGEAVVKSATIDLHTGTWEGSAGAPARQAINSLMDALVVPAEDNFT